jgi:hypothetical protein
LLLIGWKGALRTDDLHRLDTTDIATTGDGLLVHLRRSKTDQTAAGRTVAITTTTPGDPLDAVAAWVRWRNRLAAHFNNVAIASRCWSDCVRPRAHPTSSCVGVNASASSRAETPRLNLGYAAPR